MFKIPTAPNCKVITWSLEYEHVNMVAFCCKYL